MQVQSVYGNGSIFAFSMKIENLEPTKYDTTSDISISCSKSRLSHMNKKKLQQIFVEQDFDSDSNRSLTEKDSSRAGSEPAKKKQFFNSIKQENEKKKSPFLSGFVSVDKVDKGKRLFEIDSPKSSAIDESKIEGRKDPRKYSGSSSSEPSKQSSSTNRSMEISGLGSNPLSNLVSNNSFADVVDKNKFEDNNSKVS